jgi:hypothetical protein
MSRMLFSGIEAHRFLQFRLRSLVILTTLSCPVFAIYGWREQREREMLNLVERFHAELDEGRWDEAERIALMARGQFPSEPVMHTMVEKSQLIRAITKTRRA